MVVWVYAGGGDSEVGFIKLLRSYFDLRCCDFKRNLPARNTPMGRPRPNSSQTAIPGTYGDGATGSNFRGKIREHISRNWDGTAGAIFVWDDSDCADTDICQQQMKKVVEEALQAKGVPQEKMPKIIVGLAVPEIEAWLLADWTNTFQRDYPTEHHQLGKELEARKINRDDPEAFCALPETERGKMSSIIVDVVKQFCASKPAFSKGTDTPDMLGRIDPKTIEKKCPNFRNFWAQLKKLCDC